MKRPECGGSLESRLPFSWIGITFGFNGCVSIALLRAGGWSFVVWGIFRAPRARSTSSQWFQCPAPPRTGRSTRSFRTDDRSTNCWEVALLGWGEGWHNNHHAFPFSARHGLRWFEFDATWLTIAALPRSASRATSNCRHRNAAALARPTGRRDSEPREPKRSPRRPVRSSASIAARGRRRRRAAAHRQNHGAPTSG